MFHTFHTCVLNASPGLIVDEALHEGILINVLFHTFHTCVLNASPGLIVGKALYEGILINVAFAPFFVARLQGRTPMLDALATLDPALHKSLLQVWARVLRV